MSKFERNLKIVEALKLTCQALASLCRSDKSARCTLYVYYMGSQQCPLFLRETNFKENNAISHLTDDNIILYPLLPSDTLDQ